MITNGNRLMEYKSLRNEIKQKIELQNTLLTFTITTTVAIMSLALSLDITSLCLTPFFIIIPMSMRIAYYRAAMIKLSAYMIVFLEEFLDGVNWETRNALIMDKHTRKNKVYFFSLRNYECLLLAFFCYVFFLISYFRDKELNTYTMTVALSFSTLLLVELHITRLINKIEKQETRGLKDGSI